MSAPHPQAWTARLNMRALRPGDLFDPGERGGHLQYVLLCGSEAAFRAHVLAELKPGGEFDGMALEGMEGVAPLSPLQAAAWPEAARAIVADLDEMLPGAVVLLDPWTAQEG